MVFPKLSAPLVKDIRTGEGIAEWVLGAVIGVVTAVGDLGVSKGATYLTILAGIKGIRRGLLKVVALQAGLGIAAPTISAAETVTQLGADTDAAIAEVQKAFDLISAKQAEAGTPVEQVTAGLAPDDPKKKPDAPEVTA